MIKTYLANCFLNAMKLNHRNILEFASTHQAKSFLDLGCDDGSWTIEVAKAARAESTSAVELIQERASLAEQKGVQVHIGDLAEKLPLPDASFDLVHANQVIEHVPDIDLFTSEI